jgi:hypothetical protein
MAQTGSKAKLAHGWGRSAAERNPATGAGAAPVNVILRG